MLQDAVMCVISVHLSVCIHCVCVCVNVLLIKLPTIFRVAKLQGQCGVAGGGADIDNSYSSSN